MDVRSTILSEVDLVAREQGKQIRPLADSLVLLDSGLDSLCFAILIARLDDKLGSDPFTASDDVFFPATLGDFITLYEGSTASMRR